MRLRAISEKKNKSGQGTIKIIVGNAFAIGFTLYYIVCCTSSLRPTPTSGRCHTKSVHSTYKVSYLAYSVQMICFCGVCILLTYNCFFLSSSKRCVICGINLNILDYPLHVERKIFIFVAALLFERTHNFSSIVSRIKSKTKFQRKT